MDTRMRFERLFEPTSIGKMTLRNRIYMPPMADRYARDGYVTEQQIAYYEARAKGGVGLVVIGFSCVDYPVGVFDPIRTFLDDDKYIPGLTRLASAIKKHHARAAIQIGHAGARAQSHLQPVAPSPVKHPVHVHKLPRALTIEEIKGVIDHFVKAAERVKKAGFDSVIIHAAHSFLVSNFLSPVWNKREDEYGGDLNNRARFLIEIVREIKQTLGQNYPVWFRLNCEEQGVKGGLTLNDAQAIARLLQNAGADAVDVSMDRLVSSGKPWSSPNGFLLPYAEGIKKVVTIPVFVAGSITPELGEAILKDGKADLIGFGRAIIADPEMPNKIASGKLDEINPCIRCQRCYGERKTFDVLVAYENPLRCSVNPAAGREREFEVEPARRPKTVVVVGGGPGGMKAAEIASLKGHRVSLYEKDNKLGGQLHLAAIPPYKDTIRPLIGYMTNQITKLGIEIKLGKEVTPELAADMKPDVVIMATGVKPFVPEIIGIDGRNVVAGEDVLAGRAKVGGRVVVIGGEEVGCEIAEFLADQGKKVTLVRRGPELATKLNLLQRRPLLIRLSEKKVAVLTGVKYDRFTDSGMIITSKEGERKSIDADTIVLAAGAKSNIDLFESLKGKVPEVYLVGDCVEPRGIMEAIHEGAQAALSL